MSRIAVLRDKSTGNCLLVDCGDSTDNLDTERLNDSWLELAGWLYRDEQYNPAFDLGDPCDEDEEDEDDADPRPCFTTCMHEKYDGTECGRMIMIIDGGAPDHCTMHEECDDNLPHKECVKAQ